MSAQPNILLIMPDQMRGDCLSLERHPVLLTPNIDHIGAQGTHFRRAYATCPSCIPARRALLTGRFPSNNGLVGFQGGVPIRSATFPRELQKAGYGTVLVGRNMHQAPHPAKLGFKKNVLGSTYETDAYSRWLEKQAPGSGGVRGHGIGFNGWAVKPWQLPDPLHPTNWTVRQAEDAVVSHDHSKPLFLTTSFYAPHPPFLPLHFYYGRYRRQNLPPIAIGDWAKPPKNDGLGLGSESARVHLHGEALQSAQAAYFGLINQIDDQISGLVSYFILKSRLTKRPWVIVFTSDHGEMLGDHYYFRKCEPYEGSARIPFLIQGSPELGFRPGQTYEHPVCLEDLMPTLLELAGTQLPKGVDGQSLVPILRGRGTALRPWLHSEHSPCYSHEQAYHSLTDGHWKYIWRPHTGTEQLFHLQKDPKELHNLARQKDLLPWRARLIRHLQGRPEGFTDGKRLIQGRPYPAVM